MRDTCLPWLLGAKVFIPGKNLYPDQWTPPGVVTVLQYFGAGTLFVLALLSTGLAFIKRVEWPTKRVALFGAGAAGTALAGFLVSGWPSDMWSTRYLAPILWAMPFTLAPLATVLRPRGLAVLLAPYLAVAAMGGWLSYGPYVDGPLPRLDARGAATDEEQVAQYLRQRGYEYGFAQYWLAFRLTFLWQEHPTIASFEWDRYPPYRIAASTAPKQAFIFHPSEPRAVPQMVIPSLQARPGKTEVVQVAGYTLVLHDSTAVGVAP
jgi:hypothetical protein